MCAAYVHIHRTAVAATVFALGRCSGLRLRPHCHLRRDGQHKSPTDGRLSESQIVAPSVFLAFERVEFVMDALKHDLSIADNERISPFFYFNAVVLSSPLQKCKLAIDEFIEAFDFRVW